MKQLITKTDDQALLEQITRQLETRLAAKGFYDDDRKIDESDVIVRAYRAIGQLITE